MNERPFQTTVGCSTCHANIGQPCALDCARRPYSDPIVAVEAPRCWAADETCTMCICTARCIPPIPGVVCNCNGTECGNETHREHDTCVAEGWPACRERDDIETHDCPEHRSCVDAMQGCCDDCPAHDACRDTDKPCGYDCPAFDGRYPPGCPTD